MRVSKKLIGGKSVVVVDCSSMPINDTSAVDDVLKEGSKLISTCGPKSAYVITNVSKTGFNSQITDVFKSYASRNTPYVKVSIIVGMEGLQKIVFNAIKVLTGRDFVLVDNIAAAEKYLNSLK